MALALKKLVGQFGMSQETSEDCVETMTSRWHRLFAELRAKACARILAQSLPRSFSGGQPTVFTSSPSYIVAYGRLHRSAWRRLLHGAGSAELSCPLFAPPRTPTDSPMTRWSDGFEHTVADISCEDLRALLGGAKNKRDMWHKLRGGGIQRADIECSRNGGKTEHCS